MKRDIFPFQVFAIMIAYMDLNFYFFSTHTHLIRQANINIILGLLDTCSCAKVNSSKLFINIYHNQFLL